MKTGSHFRGPETPDFGPETSVQDGLVERILTALDRIVQPQRATDYLDAAFGGAVILPPLADYRLARGEVLGVRRCLGHQDNAGALNCEIVRVFIGIVAGDPHGGLAEPLCPRVEDNLERRGPTVGRHR